MNGFSFLSFLSGALVGGFMAFIVLIGIGIAIANSASPDHESVRYQQPTYLQEQAQMPDGAKLQYDASTGKFVRVQ